MRITLDVGEGMVFAMDRDPLAGFHARRQPQHHAKAGGEGRADAEGAVREGAMEIYGRAERRDLRHDEPGQQGEDQRGHVFPNVPSTYWSVGGAAEVGA